MPVNLINQNNGEIYSISIHGERADCSRQPAYIKNCKAIARTVKLNGRSTHFYFGYREEERINFELNEIWCHVNDVALYTQLENLDLQCEFLTDGEFVPGDIPENR